MEFKSGDRVQVESESTERPPRTGVVEEVVQGTAQPSLSDPLGRRAREHLHTRGGRAASAEPTEKA